MLSLKIIIQIQQCNNMKKTSNSTKINGLIQSKQFLIKYKQPQLITPQNNTQMICKSQISEYQLASKSLKKQKDDKINDSSIQNILSQNNFSIQKKHKSKQRSYITPKKQQQKNKQVRIPIQYYDQDKNHQIYSKKMIYKGYTPRSSYYYLKTLKPINIKQHKQLLTIRKDSQLAFNSKFQNGNLNYAIKISPIEYHLFMREDTNTKGLRQWFYFQVCNKKSIRIKFRIYKFCKKFSLYLKGYKPFVVSKKDMDDGKDWLQKGQNIIYQYDDLQRSYYVEFQYFFEEQNDITYFASLPPYTYTQMIYYTNSLIQNQIVKKYRLGLSLSGLQIPVIQINKPSQQQKQFIVVLARTHPGQTVSSFALEGFIEQIMKNQILKERYTFIIIPMLNVDGVYIGNHRTGILGQDLNRHFNIQDDQYFPQIIGLKKLIKNIKKRGKIRFFFDLHGHSAKRGIFAFGGQQESGSPKYLYNRIIPYILSNISSIFRYESCVFKNSKEKKNCARMHFMRIQKIIGITFQESYGLFYDQSLNKNVPIGMHNWRNFGKNLALALQQFNNLIYNKIDPIKILRQYMKQQINLSLQEQKLLSNQIAKKLTSYNNIKTLQNQNIDISSVTICDTVPNLSCSVARSTSKQKIIVPDTIEEIQQNGYESQNNQELQSEDQALQMNAIQLQKFKKKINFFIREQPTPREQLNIAQTQFALDELQYYRIRNEKIHQIIKPHMIPKVFKMHKQSNIRQRFRLGQSFKLSQLQLPAIKKRY